MELLDNRGSQPSFRWMMVATLLGGCAASCGTVVVHKDGSGSGGNASQMSSVSGTTSNTGSNQSTGAHDPSSSTGGLDLCDAFCAATGNCYTDCHTTCTSYQDPPCESEGAAVVSCITANYDATSCQIAGDCGMQLNAFFMCQGEHPLDCGPSTCGGDGTTFCSCTAQCKGGERKGICNVLNGIADCDCFVNGIGFVSCPGETNATCQLDLSCCGF